MGEILNKSLPLLKKNLGVKPGSLLTEVIGIDNIFRKEAKDRIISITKKEIKFYKNRVFPMIMDTVERISAELDNRLNTIVKYPTVVYMDYPGFVEDIPEIGLLKFSPVRLDLALNIDPLVYIEGLGDTGFDLQVKEHLSNLKISYLEDLYKEFIRDTLMDPSNQRKLSKPTYYKELVDVYCLVYAIQQGSAPEETRGKLEDYRFYMKYLYSVYNNFLRNQLKRLSVANDKRELVIYNDKSRIAVNGMISDEFYNSGGVIELLYGYIFKEDGKGIGNTIEGILGESDYLLEQWKSHLSGLSIMRVKETKGILMTLYRSEFRDVNLNFEEFTNSIEDLFNEFNKVVSEDEFTNVTTAVEKYILDVVLKNTNARMFVDLLNKYKEDQDLAEAARSATIDMIVSFLLNQTVVSEIPEV